MFGLFLKRPVAKSKGSVENIQLGDPKSFKVPTLCTVNGAPRSHRISQALFDELYGDDLPIQG